MLCEPGDIILIQGPGAGGYGDPALRPLEAVADDVRRGFVSREAARTDYGVELNDRFEVDVQQSTCLRTAMATQGGLFRHGEGRVAFESVWSLDRYDALHRVLAEVPVTWRFFVKQRIFGALRSPGDAFDVFEEYQTLRGQFPDLPPLPASERAKAVE